MPCYTYSIPASRCITGRKLRDVAGSVCAICYALKGNYRFGNVQSALERRFDSIDKPEWVSAMVTVILGREKSGFFRWHDSGDLQSVAHFSRIVAVCRQTPGIRHWLPTREYAIVSRFVAGGGVIPPNLTVRLSALMVDGPAPAAIADRLGVQTSGVSASAFSCPASKQANKCGDCRACWSKDIPSVSYKTH